MLEHNRKSAIENGRPEKKSRKCNSSHLDVGFTFILQNEKEKNQCVVCSKVLPTKACYQISLERHLKIIISSHPQFVNKPG